jgi:hypothetical protein
MKWRAGNAGGMSLIQALGDTYPCAECCKGGPPAPANLSLILLAQAAQDDGAVCLDGSPAAMYIDFGDQEHFVIFQEVSSLPEEVVPIHSVIKLAAFNFTPPPPPPPAQKNLFLIVHGGGWCNSNDSCSLRANTTLGSSTDLAAFSNTIMSSEGFLSNDPAINAPFWNWTRVFLNYCDGSSQLSDVSDPVVVPAAPISPIFYRGARVRAAQEAYLLTSAGLAGAKEVVVAGCSAGGLSTYLHIDKWAAAVPNAKVSGLADSGFFLNYDWTTGTASSGQPGQSAFPSNLSYPYRMWWIWNSTNVIGALTPACVAAQSTGSEWLCLFAENIVPVITTPLFALQSYYDSYQTAAIAHLNNSDPNITAFNAYGALLRDTVKNSFKKNPASGFALDACAHHCGPLSWDDITFPKNGSSQAQTANAWRQGLGGSDEQVAVFPCITCCQAVIVPG